MCGVTKLDEIRNERIRRTTKVGRKKKYGKAGHIMRRGKDYVGKRLIVMDVPGKRRKGRSKRGCTDCIKHKSTEKGLSGEGTQDRTTWRRLLRNNDST